MENAYLQALFNSTDDGVCFIAPNHTIRAFNKAAEAITGYTQEEVLGLPCADNLLNRVDMEDVPFCGTGSLVYKTLQDGKEHTGQLLLRHKNGTRVPIKIRSIPVWEKGQLVGALQVFKPCSPVRYSEDFVHKMANQALYDPLTGLPNRAHIEGVLQHKLQEHSRYGNLFGVLFLDVDNFNQFNNRYGHLVGDAVLKAIATSCNRYLRRVDRMGRWGGEEFLGVFTLRKPEHIEVICEKTRKMVEDIRIPHEEDTLAVTASIGGTLAREDDTLESIIYRADTLMYKSKKGGKNRYTTDYVHRPPDKP